MHTKLMARAVATLVLALSAFGLAPAARADTFTYTFTNSGKEIQFTESAILTSDTTVTSFSVNTLGAFSFEINPTNGTCEGVHLGSAACVGYLAGGAFTILPFSQDLNATGTFTATGGQVLTISQQTSSVPEPSSLLLLLSSGCGLLGVIRRKMRA